MQHKFRVVFLSMLGEPGRYDPAIYDKLPGGDDEIFWFRSLMERSGLLARMDFCGLRITHGDPLPGWDQADAFVLGGSFHSVHDGRPWQDALFAWLRAGMALATPAPLLGICGGHQAMCHVMGEQVATLPEDQVMHGTLPVTLTDVGATHPLFAGMGAAPEFQFGNFDHVVAPPAGSKILAVCPQLPAAALDHGKGWFSVQFHPEADHEMFAETWRPFDEKIASCYRLAPDAYRLIENFLLMAGMAPAATLSTNQGVA